MQQPGRSEAVYLSGWQVAAGNTSETMYPDQSRCTPADRSLTMVRRINNT